MFTCLQASRGGGCACFTLPHSLRVPSDSWTKVGVEELGFILSVTALSPESYTQTLLNSKPIYPTAYQMSPPRCLIAQTQHVRNRIPDLCPHAPPPGNLLFPVSVNDVLPMAQVKNLGVICDSPSSHPHIKSMRNFSSDCSSTPLPPHPWNSSDTSGALLPHGLCTGWPLCLISLPSCIFFT